MLKQYNKVAYRISKRVTHSYSTSFGWGIRAFAPEYRDAIYAIYGFVRIADEIVDTFHGFDKKSLLNKFKKDTLEAINQGISTNPVIHSFQEVVNEYNIEWDLIDKFLVSMEMDLSETSFERNYYDDYIFGSAEAVGLMCLKVFVNGSDTKYEALKSSARLLGSAFQKVNFLRDIKADLKERGRIYLPGVHEMDLINNVNKQRLEKEAENEFNEALNGIKKLPIGVKLGVYSTYLYYRALFNKIKSSDIEKLLNDRIRISNFRKFRLLIKSYVEVRILKLT